jgi:hypothetical protein
MFISNVNAIVRIKQASTNCTSILLSKTFPILCSKIDPIDPTLKHGAYRYRRLDNLICNAVEVWNVWLQTSNAVACCFGRGSCRYLTNARETLRVLMMNLR